jgi:hypothetical protein
MPAARGRFLEAAADRASQRKPSSASLATRGRPATAEGTCRGRAGSDNGAGASARESRKLSVHRDDVMRAATARAARAGRRSRDEHSRTGATLLARSSGRVAPVARLALVWALDCRSAAIHRQARSKRLLVLATAFPLGVGAVRRSWALRTARSPPHVLVMVGDLSALGRADLGRRAEIVMQLKQPGQFGRYRRPRAMPPSRDGEPRGRERADSEGRFSSASERCGIRALPVDELHRWALRRPPGTSAESPRPIRHLACRVSVARLPFGVRWLSSMHASDARARRGS